MVAAHFVDLAALLSQAQPPAFLERKIILHVQTHHGGNPREGVDHDGDKGSVAQTYHMRRIDLFKKFARFLRGHGRGRAPDNGVPWPTHGVRRVGRQHLARHQPVKQHADTGQMLLNGGRFAGNLQLLDIARHMHRPHVAEPHLASRFSCGRDPSRRFPLIELSGDRRNQ